MPFTHEAVVKRRDIFDVDPRLVKIDPTWNQRKDFGNMEEMEASIVANGVLEPITVRVVDADMVLVNGERRIRATLSAIKNGHDIKSVPAMLARRGISDTEALILATVKNDGKPFLPSEEAAVYQKLRAWGMDVKDIAARFGRSAPHVYNRLKLVDAAPEVKTAVDTKQIGVTDAKAIITESGGDVQKQKDKLKEPRDKPPKILSRKEIMETLDTMHGLKPANASIIGVKTGLWMVLNNETDYITAMESMKRDGWIK
jgi:ParB/RepB/Spo0J family partition protein